MAGLPLQLRIERDLHSYHHDGYIITCQLSGRGPRDLCERLLEPGRSARANAGTIAPVDATAQRQWLEQWKQAGKALEEQRRTELRSLTAERALAASEALLALAAPARLSAKRRSYSGLVEQQRLFHRRAR
jgi:hypothetical protein